MCFNTLPRNCTEAEESTVIFFQLHSLKFYLNQYPSIFQALLSKREIRVNETNDDGQTSLLCAVKMHGMMDEQTQHKIDNKSIIEMLIKAGADPTIAVSGLCAFDDYQYSSFQETSTGKTIVHHAVDKMDVELLDVSSEFPRVSLINKYLKFSVLKNRCQRRHVHRVGKSLRLPWRHRSRPFV